MGTGEIMKNTIFYGDNLIILKKLKPESIDLIYLDPPFNSKRQYNILYKEPNGTVSKAQTLAFDDTWTWSEETQRTYEEIITNPNVGPDVVSAIKAFHEIFGTSDLMSYLVMMTIRLIELRRVLKPTGSIYLHCDPTASHYLKIIMDSIFGSENFQNEVIWCYRTGGATKKRFSRKHDVIFFYSKTDDFFFNCIKEREYYEKPFFNPQQDENGRYFADVLPVDWWLIPAVINVSKERTDYPTQKPLLLLEKIIKYSCPPNGIVLDPFCGCGTALIATQKLNSSELSINRTWIGIDITYLAISVLKERFQKELSIHTHEFDIIGEPVSKLEAEKLAEQNKHQFAIWAITKLSGKPNIRKSGDQGVDGYYDFIDNNVAKRGIIQVKGGHINPSDMRDFCHTVSREKAHVGIFLTLEEPSKQMIQEANGQGFYKDAFGNQYKKISIITVDELLEKHYTIPPPKR